MYIQLQDLQLQLDQKISEQKGETNPRSTKKICKDLRNVQIERANMDMSKDLAEAEEELERMKLEFEREVENLRIDKLHLEKELSDLKVLNIDGTHGKMETLRDKYELSLPTPVNGQKVAADDHIETVENSPVQTQPDTAESIENSPLQEQECPPESIENSPLQAESVENSPPQIAAPSIEIPPQRVQVTAKSIQVTSPKKVVKNTLSEKFTREIHTLASIKAAPIVAADPPRSSISLFASKYRDENDPKNSTKVDATKKSVADEFSERMQRDQRFKKIRENCLKNTQSGGPQLSSPKRNVSRSPLSPVREDAFSSIKNKAMIWEKNAEMDKSGKRDIRGKDKENSPQRDPYQEKDANWEQTLRGSERSRTALITAPVRDRIAYWEKENSAKDSDREVSWEKTLRGKTPVQTKTPTQTKATGNTPRFVISPVRAVSPLTRLGKVVDTTLSQIVEPFEQPVVPAKATLPPRPPNVNSPTPGLPLWMTSPRVNTPLVPEGVASPPANPPHPPSIQAAPKAITNPVCVVNSPTPGPVTRVASTRVNPPTIPEGVTSSPVRAPSARLNVPLLAISSTSPQPGPSRAPSVHIASARSKPPTRPTSAVSSPSHGPVTRVASTRFNPLTNPEGVASSPIRAPSARLNVPSLAISGTSPQPGSSRVPSARMEVPKYSLGTDSSTGRVMSNRFNHPIHPVPIVIHEDKGPPKPAEGDGSITPRTRAKCVSARNVISTRLNFKVISRIIFTFILYVES